MAVTTRRMGVVLGMLVWLSAATSASAQVFGTFSWQMQPFCNVITLTLTQVPTGFTVDGTDNLCNVGGQRAGVTGMAHINPDGTVGMEFTIVTLPLARPVHVFASLNPGTGSGGWNDSQGNTGILALGQSNPGLQPRPAVTVGLQRTVVSNAVTVPAGSSVSPTSGFLDSPACPTGTTLAGGGAGWAANFLDLFLVSSMPINSSTQWRGAYRSQRSSSAVFEVYAICLK